MDELAWFCQCGDGRKLLEVESGLWICRACGAEYRREAPLCCVGAGRGLGWVGSPAIRGRVSPRGFLIRDEKG